MSAKLKSMKASAIGHCRIFHVITNASLKPYQVPRCRRSYCRQKFTTTAPMIRIDNAMVRPSATSLCFHQGRVSSSRTRRSANPSWR
jgi:hypothetical protein